MAPLAAVALACVMGWARELHSAAEVKGYAVSFREGATVMVKYYTPRCAHCVSLAPSYDLVKEAVGQWSPDDVHPLHFAEMNCDLHHRDCNKLDVVAFPSLYFYNWQGNKYMEYPRLPRTPEALTAFIARNRQRARFYPLSKMDKYVPQICPTDLSFDSALCRAQRIENYVIGSQEALLKLDATYSKIHLFMPLFYGAPERLGLAEDEVCIIERFTRQKRLCVNVNDESDWADKLKKELKYAHIPRVVPQANWYDLYSLREDSGKRVVVLPTATGELTPEVLGLVSEVRDEFVLLLLDARDEDMQRLYRQTIGSEASPHAIAFAAGKYDKSFHSLPATAFAENLGAVSVWLESVAQNKLDKEYHERHRSSVAVLWTTLRTMPQVLSTAYHELSTARKTQLVVGMLVLTIAWLYVALPDGVFEKAAEDEYLNVNKSPTKLATVLDRKQSFVAEKLGRDTETTLTHRPPRPAPRAANPPKQVQYFTLSSDEKNVGVCIVNGSEVKPL